MKEGGEERNTLLSALALNPLFRGLDEEGTLRQMRAMRAERTRYEKGALLHAAGKPMKRFGIVITGLVQVCADDIEGGRMIMAEVTPGTSFGESLCFLKAQDSPVYIYASEDSEVLWLTPEALYDGPGDAFQTELLRRFTAALAEKNLSMNNRIQVLSKLSLRGKLYAYFTELAAEQGSNTILLPMNRDDTAAYIGANRSALSRELARMKAEGLIDYYRNAVRILGDGRG